LIDCALPLFFLKLTRKSSFSLSLRISSLYSTYAYSIQTEGKETGKAMKTVFMCKYAPAPILLAPEECLELCISIKNKLERMENHQATVDYIASW
jgi:hypothetical protein